MEKLTTGTGLREIDLHLLDLKDLADPLDMENPSSLPPVRQDQLVRYRQPGPRRQSYGAGWLLQVLMDQAGFSRQDQASYAYDACGRPYFKNLPDFSFSLSHSGEVVIAALPHDTGACNGRLGCDVERVRKYPEGLVRRFFTGREQEYLKELSSEEARREFCRFWTRKESVLKAVGIGLALPLTAFDVCQAGRIVLDEGVLREWMQKQRQAAEKETYQESKESQREKYELYLQAADFLLQHKLYVRDFLFVRQDLEEAYFCCVCADRLFDLKFHVKKACKDQMLMVDYKCCEKGDGPLVQVVY